MVICGQGLSLFLVLSCINRYNKTKLVGVFFSYFHVYVSAKSLHARSPVGDRWRYMHMYQYLLLFILFACDVRQAKLPHSIVHGLHQAVGDDKADVADRHVVSGWRCGRHRQWRCQSELAHRCGRAARFARWFSPCVNQPPPPLPSGVLLNFECFM